MSGIIDLVVLAVVLLAVLAVEWRRQRRKIDRDSVWERRMKALRWRDQWRISKAVRAGRRLDNPREAQIAVEMAEIQQRSQGNATSVISILHVALGGALVALGALGASVPVLALGGVFLLLGVVGKIQEGRIAARVQQAERLNREQASLDRGNRA